MDEEDKKSYSDNGYSTYAATGDIYCLFYEMGYRLLRNDGTLGFITSNKWMRAGYGDKLRGFLTKNTNPMILIDFAGQKVFEEATVDVNVLIFSKSPNIKETICCIVKKDCLENMSEYVEQTGYTRDFTGDGSWSILSPIEQQIKDKIERVGTPLKNWNIRINYGIKTGYNEAFIIDGTKRENSLLRILICGDHTTDFTRQRYQKYDIKTLDYG